jgi:hypothetical protein
MSANQRLGAGAAELFTQSVARAPRSRAACTQPRPPASRQAERAFGLWAAATGHVHWPRALAWRSARRIEQPVYFRALAGTLPCPSRAATHAPRTHSTSPPEPGDSDGAGGGWDSFDDTFLQGTCQVRAHARGDAAWETRETHSEPGSLGRRAHPARARGRLSCAKGVWGEWSVEWPRVARQAPEPAHRPHAWPGHHSSIGWKHSSSSGVRAFRPASPSIECSTVSEGSRMGLKRLANPHTGHLRCRPWRQSAHHEVRASRPASPGTAPGSSRERLVHRPGARAALNFPHPRPPAGCAAAAPRVAKH